MTASINSRRRACDAKAWAFGTSCPERFPLAFGRTYAQVHVTRNAKNMLRCLAISLPHKAQCLLKLVSFCKSGCTLRRRAIQSEYSKKERRFRFFLSSKDSRRANSELFGTTLFLAVSESSLWRWSGCVYVELKADYCNYDLTRLF